MAIDLMPPDDLLIERTEIPMEGTRFDTLIRRLPTPSTRHAAVRTFAATGLGLGLTGAALRSTLAGGKKAVTARCKKSDECQGGLTCKKANSQHFYSKTEKRCCKVVGDSCKVGQDCCGIEVICNGGYCDKA